MSLIDPSTWNNPWVLSEGNGKGPVSIPQNVLKDFGRQDLIVLDFLFRSYMKKLSGVILNEEEDLNPQLQVSSFLGALYNSVKNKFLVLVLCPDALIIKWHYYMSQGGQFEVKIITPNTVPEDFDREAGIVLLLSFTNIKLAEYLKEYDIFSVVIDHFDEIASKLVIRKLQGNFNIGLTSRNFYVDPDQKLQWTMLNWANTGCVGKLADFYEIDNENVAGFRNNYQEWWFRLTWNFCDTFVKPTLEENGKLNNTLREWAKTHNLTENYTLKSEKRSKNRKKQVSISQDINNKSVEDEDTKQNKQPRKVYSKNARSTNSKTEQKFDSSDSSSDSSDCERQPDTRKRKVNPNPKVNKRFSSEDNKQNKRAKKVYNKNTKSPKKISYKTASSNSTNKKSDQTFRNLDFSSDGSSDSSDTVIYENPSYLMDEITEDLDNDEPPIGGPMIKFQLSQTQFEKEGDLEKDEKSQEILDQTSDVSHCDDENASVSSGEQLLCSLVRTQTKDSPKKTKQDRQNDSEYESFDESDLFLKSVASTNSDFSTLKNRQKSDKFFNKVLEKSDEKPLSNAVSQMELELTEKEALDIDIPSESDSFLKGIFNKSCKDESRGRSDATEVENGSESADVSFSSGHVDVDMLVAEVREMVGKNNF